MATSTSGMAAETADEVADQCANLVLADVDDEEFIVRVPDHSGDQGVDDDTYYAVGRLLTNRPVRFAFFQDTMAGVWQPAMGVNMRELQPRKFLFRFYHEGDLDRIISEGPWAFDQSLLVMQRVTRGMDPEMVPLTHADFWIQMHNLPVGYRSDAVVRAVGACLGTVVQTDERNFDGAMRSFYRVRVALDVAKLLKRQLKLKRDDGGWSHIDFRYERLPTFCFLCGMIGHGDKWCRLALDRTVLSAEKLYGAWLRASARRGAPTQNQCWIPSQSTAERRNWKSPVMGDSHGGGIGNQGEQIVLETVVSGELKRRRVEGEERGAGANMDCDTSASKNYLGAGLAAQTRQES
ncbi:PREDICTED: uncharacterized protein LOC109164448 [Ipomoea nil]|uniref:uncharacterized protein LOC109164448 n=1 Tax=Ipomoea nil TaxID=35883 RepID=UPI000900C927|nr:PREDICTED: uncharacterized protein LOC109164448 [Ipomoea nil]